MVWRRGHTLYQSDFHRRCPDRAGEGAKAADADGALCSKCVFLYHEIYSVENGYEVHMLFAIDGRSDLAYLTVRCGDICFEDNIVLPR